MNSFNSKIAEIGLLLLVNSFETEFVEGVTGEEYSSTLQAIANIAI